MIFVNFTNDDVERAIVAEGKRSEIMAEFSILLEKFARANGEDPADLLDEMKAGLTCKGKKDGDDDGDDDRDKIIKALARYMKKC